MPFTAYFGVVDPLGIGDARRLFSERLRQVFMKPRFACINIIANRYRVLRSSALGRPRLLRGGGSRGRICCHCSSVSSVFLTATSTEAPPTSIGRCISPKVARRSRGLSGRQHLRGRVLRMVRVILENVSSTELRSGLPSVLLRAEAENPSPLHKFGTSRRDRLLLVSS
jgi:hypothetical protein